MQPHVLTVSCDDPDDPSPVEETAAAVELVPSSVRLPFDLTALPEGYGVSQIMQNRSPGSARVDVGRVRQGSTFADSDLEIASDAEDPSPEVCVAIQGERVCVGITARDTGPYPDRSAEIPTLLTLADARRFPPDVADQSTWFAAERVFG